MTDTSLLIVSCDKYSDLWKPFFNLLWKYWPDLSFDTYLLSNNQVFHDSRVNGICVGNDKNWSHGLVKALEEINTTYVVLMLEDFFLQQPVDNNRIQECVKSIADLNGNMLRLIPNPGPDKSISESSLIGKITPNSPYRVSTQAAIWKKSALMTILKDGESAWEFEINGTERSFSDKDGYYSVWQPVITYRHVVERGKWFRNQAQKYGAMNIGCDFEHRPIMSFKETLIFKKNRMLSHVKSVFPWTFRQNVKKILLRL